MATVSYLTINGEIVSETRDGVNRDYLPDPPDPCQLAAEVCKAFAAAKRCYCIVISCNGGNFSDFPLPIFGPIEAECKAVEKACKASGKGGNWEFKWPAC